MRLGRKNADMARIVAGIGISHAPGALGRPGAPPAEVRQRLEARRLDRQQTFLGAPDVAEALLRSCVARGFDVARMGAMDGAPAEVVAYEAVPDWICGMAYVDFMPGGPDR